MSQDFKKWVVAKIDEGFYGVARVQFLSTLKNEPEKVKDFVRDRLSKFCSEYEAETHNMSISNPDEIIEELKDHFKTELTTIPERIKS